MCREVLLIAQQRKVSQKWPKGLLPTHSGHFGLTHT
jgi:hypothetical protein